MSLLYVYHKRLDNPDTYPTSNPLLNMHLHAIHCARKLKPETPVRKPLRMPSTSVEVMRRELDTLPLDEYYKRRAEDYCYIVTESDDDALVMMEQFS